MSDKQSASIKVSNSSLSKENKAANPQAIHGEQSDRVINKAKRT